MVKQILYKKPYIDSAVFIGWIKNERISQKDKDGKSIADKDGNPVIEERGKIGAHILKLAEQRIFPVIISALTLAEVHKHRGQEKLTGDENSNIIDFFEHDFVEVRPVTRKIGQEANKLCRKYEDKKLSPNDAIHLACAKEAGCDILLSWDGPLNLVNEPGIRIEKPIIWTPPTGIKMEQMLLLKDK